MYIEPSVVKQITGGIMVAFTVFGFVLAINKHIFSQSADNSISELFGTWFNYVATGIAVALVSGVGVYALNSLLRS
jgi:succinate dehydrogenase/fumarate reductase cytochrome b subunit